MFKWLIFYTNEFCTFFSQKHNAKVLQILMKYQADFKFFGKNFL